MDLALGILFGVGSTSCFVRYHFGLCLTFVPMFQKAFDLKYAHFLFSNLEKAFVRSYSVKIFSITCRWLRFYPFPLSLKYLNINAAPYKNLLKVALVAPYENLLWKSPSVRGIRKGCALKIGNFLLPATFVLLLKRLLYFVPFGLIPPPDLGRPFLYFIFCLPTFQIIIFIWALIAIYPLALLVAESKYGSLCCLPLAQSSCMPS